ncbi:hypothetical protein [uncultured Kriegella sp.]|uniref:hypothetical protein n=1 Tax=uncultured Kriegella sp. TaxID=1798910 RepID=UPI0030DA8BF1|tara:strand:- start:69504 stop:70451 length:948 start_codon:yes stop_codon:yes gene_type:complete
MKRLFLLIALLFIVLGKAQYNQDNNDVLLGVYVPEQAENIPNNARSLLRTRLMQLITANGISGNVLRPRFFVVPRIAVLGKEILGTAPSRVVLDLEMALIIGDNETEKGNLFHTEFVNLKGVGQNEQKAYIAAIKRIAPKNPKLIAFLEHTKKEIINYYEEHCEEVKKKAYALKAQDQTEEAVKIIANIPLSSNCYAENEDDIGTFFQNALDQKCRQQLNTARSIWYADQSLEGAKEAGKVLSKIEPRAWCKDELKLLYKEIATRVRELGDNEWLLTLKEVDVAGQSTKYAREILLEYAKNQPQHIIKYNVGGWY